MLALSAHYRLADVITHATGTAPPHDCPVWTVPLSDPAAVREVAGLDRTVLVTGAWS